MRPMQLQEKLSQKAPWSSTRNFIVEIMRSTPNVFPMLADWWSMPFLIFIGMFLIIFYCLHNISVIFGFPSHVGKKHKTTFIHNIVMEAESHSHLPFQAPS